MNQSANPFLTNSQTPQIVERSTNVQTAPHTGTSPQKSANPNPVSETNPFLTHSPPGAYQPPQLKPLELKVQIKPEDQFKMDPQFEKLMDSLIEDVYLTCNKQSVLNEQEVQEFMQKVFQAMQDHKLDKDFFKGHQISSQDNFKYFF